MTDEQWAEWTEPSACQARVEAAIERLYPIVLERRQRALAEREAAIQYAGELLRQQQEKTRAERRIGENDRTV